MKLKAVHAICEKHLFSLVQSLGGSQNWLNTPAYINSRKGYKGDIASSVHFFLEGRRHKVSPTPRSNLSTSSHPWQKQKHFVCCVSHRKIQRYCGSTLKRKASPRVTSPPSRNGKDLRQMGRPRYWLLRFSRLCGSKTACLPELQRSSRPIHRRLQSILKLQTRLALSTTQLHSQSFSLP